MPYSLNVQRPLGLSNQDIPNVVMPGHVKRGGTGEPDPDPTPFLFISFEQKQKDMKRVRAKLWFKEQTDKKSLIPLALRS